MCDTALRLKELYISPGEKSVDWVQCIFSLELNFIGDQLLKKK